MKRLMYSLIIMAGVAWLSEAHTVFALTGWSTKPTDNAQGDCQVGSASVDGKITGDKALGCQCGQQYNISSIVPVIVTCPDIYVCGSNQYNPYSYTVCLKKVGQSCPTKTDSECDGGSVCDLNSGACTISSSEFSGVVGNTTADIRDTVRRFINIALGFLGVVTVIMIIYGGVLWLTAMGSDDKVQKGKNILLWAAIGAIVISIAWTISSYILKVGETIG